MRGVVLWVLICACASGVSPAAKEGAAGDAERSDSTARRSSDRDEPQDGRRVARSRAAGARSRRRRQSATDPRRPHQEVARLSLRPRRLARARGDLFRPRGHEVRRARVSAGGALPGSGQPRLRLRLSQARVRVPERQPRRPRTRRIQEGDGVERTMPATSRGCGAAERGVA